MPKKGKGKGKKKGKGDKKKDAGPAPPAKLEEEPLNELSKQFYLIQISDLEERLGRYQVKCDHLQLQNDGLQLKLKQQLDDQEQMITFLKRKSQEQAEQYNDLEDRAQTVQKVKDSEKEKYEQQISQLKEDSQKSLDQLAVENKVLQGQLESLETFRVNREKLEAEMRKKEETIEQQKKEHEEALYRIEKKAVLDKDRTKKEMVTKVNSVAAEFRKVSDLQMAETTKRTIRENVTINQQLTKMSDKTITLIQENEKLREKEKDLRRQLEILEFNEKEMARKHVSSKKVMGMLEERAGSAQAEVSHLQGTAQHEELLKQEVMRAQSLAEESSEECKVFRGRVSHLENELAKVKTALSETTYQLEKLKTILGKASKTIQSSLQPASDPTEGPHKRENLLSTLLDILSYAQQNPPSTSSSKLQQQQHTQGANTTTSSRSPPPPPPSVLKYKPGDLGLVPAPAAAREEVQGVASGTTSSNSSSRLLPPLSVGGSPLTGGKRHVVSTLAAAM